MRPLEDVLSNMVGRTIIEIGTEDDEIMLTLDDGLVFWFHVDDDGSLMMTVNHENSKPQQ